MRTLRQMYTDLDRSIPGVQQLAMNIQRAIVLVCVREIHMERWSRPCVIPLNRKHTLLGRDILSNVYVSE